MYVSLSCGWFVRTIDYNKPYSYFNFFYFPIARPCDVKQIAGSTPMVISTGTVEITFAADDPSAVFRCKLDKAQFVNCEFRI